MQPAPPEDDASALEGVRVGVPIRWAGPVVALLALSGIALVALSFSMRADGFLASFLSGLGVATVASFVAPRLFFEPPCLPLRRCAVTREGIVTRRGARLLSAERILGVEIEPAPRGHVVRAFDRRLVAFEIRLARAEDTDTAARLLRGARGRGVVALRAQPWATLPETAVAVATVAGVLVTTVTVGGPLLVPFVVLLAVIMIASTPTRVVVGDDAVHVRWLARGVTLPMGAITRATAGTAGATLHAGGVTRFFAMPPAAARRFVVRVGEALEAARAAVPSELESRLDRGGRALDAWIDDLRDLASDRRTYRVTAPPRGALIAVVEDVNRRAIDRAAAAIALAAADDAARDVVHAVACATADPELRCALEQAARGERVDRALLDLLAARKPPRPDSILSSPAR